MQQKSNRASIIVAILAFVLILGAVFILNQTFRNRSEDKRTASSSSSSSSQSSSSSEEESESSSSFSESSLFDDETENPDDISSSSSTRNSASSSQSGSSSSVDTSDLNDGQAIVKVLSVKGSEYQIETVSSKGIESKFFASGAKTRVNLSGVTLEQGKTYKVSITAKDTATGFSLEKFVII